MSIYRSDLAIEATECFNNPDESMQGVSLEEEYSYNKSIKITTVKVTDSKGEELIRKPIGEYITLEVCNTEADYEEELLQSLSHKLIEIVKMNKYDKTLIAGLGNREITPDSLGPLVIDNLFITSHLIREYGDKYKNDANLNDVCAIAPGVMAQTGMETGLILKGIVNCNDIQLVIVIDALAARSTRRLNKTIQIADTGISPGAGVGNNRNAINEETINAKVIAIGVPTVVDAATIVNDSLERYMQSEGIGQNDIDTFINGLNQKNVDNMFVTPKDIDEEVKKLSIIISDAINQAVVYNT